tara:strand:- start:6357 stop:7436 length:1080 start_codon:yes stop_codon:yes gene_type:complete
MANKSRTDVQTAINTNLADNSTGNISAADTRGTQTDLNDSGFNVLSDNADAIVDGINKVLMIPAERTKLGFIDVTQSVNLDTLESLVASAEQTSNKNVPNGYAGLDGSSQILASQIPAIAITEFLGTVVNETAMLALTGQKGDWCLRSDVGTNFVITGTDPSIISSWTELSYPASPVVSVNSQVGTVILNSDDISDLGFANKFVTAADITTLSNTSGTNTGDQDLSNLVDLTNPQSISGNKTFTGSTVAASLASFRPVGTPITTNVNLENVAANTFYDVTAIGGAFVITVTNQANTDFPIGSEWEFSPIDLSADISFATTGAPVIESVDGNFRLDKVFSGTILKKTADNKFRLIGTLKA